MQKGMNNIQLNNESTDVFTAYGEDGFIMTGPADDMELEPLAADRNQEAYGEPTTDLRAETINE